MSLLLFLLLLVSLVIPRAYLALYIWLLLVFYWLYSFPTSYPYTDKSLSYTLGEAFFYLYTLVLVASVLIRLSIILGLFLIEQTRTTSTTNNKSDPIVNQITFGAYGILAGYYLYLWLTDFLQYYQPAWEAYVITILIILLLFLASHFARRFRN